MPSKRLIVGAVVLALVGASAGLVLPHVLAAPAIKTNAVGTCREVGVKYPMTMVITRAKAYDSHYDVLYRRYAFHVGPATLKGDKIDVWGENAISDVMYVLAYDAKRDQLVTTLPGGAPVRLERVSP